MPKHNGLIGKQSGQLLAKQISVPQWVVAPGNKGNVLVTVLRNQLGKAFEIGFGRFGTGKFSSRQGPVIRGDKGELCQYRW